MKKLTGLIAAPFTPMDDNGELALGQIEKLARLYEKNSVNGAFLCGSTGEGVSLTYDEKVRVMKQWGKVKGNVTTIFMVGGTCVKDMQSLALHSRDNGMDAVAILCPYYFKPDSVADLVKLTKEVADTVPDMPLYYYHIPALTGGHFSMTEFLKQADEQIPNLAGIKYTALTGMEYHSCRIFKEEKYNLLWGVDEMFLAGLALGARGAVGSTYNYAAPLYNQIIAAFDQGDMKEAERLQQLSVKMVELLVKYGGNGAGKAFMKLIGLDCGWFRLPVMQPTEEAVQALKVELDDLGFFDFCSKV